MDDPIHSEHVNSRRQNNFERRGHLGNAIFCGQNTGALDFGVHATCPEGAGAFGVVERFNALAGKLSGMGMLPKYKAHLEGYVTGKTLDGLYYMIGEEEKKIRLNPAKAGRELLSKVLGSLR